MLSKEYFVEHDMTTRDSFNAKIAFMESRGILKVRDDSTVEANVKSPYFDFVLRLGWPIIDGYWLTAVYAYSLVPNYYCAKGSILDYINEFSLKLHDDKIIPYIESCSADLIKNAIAQLKVSPYLTFRT